MSQTPNQLILGAPAPAFALPEVIDGATVSSDDLDGEVLVVAFLSRHCPYVKHVQGALAALAADYLADGRVAIAGICANDVDNYPEDAPERLADQKREVGFAFPYLHDASQAIARAYGAVCTPDFFVFDADRTLAYRGRMDATRPGGDPATGDELRAAIDALLAGGRPGDDQAPPLGCGIKWRPGNEPG